MLLLTMPDQSTVELAVECSRRLNPELVLVARCTRANHLRRLQELGVTTVQPEFEGGLEMVRQGLVRCGRAGEEVGPIIESRGGICMAASLRPRSTGPIGAKSTFPITSGAWRIIPFSLPIGSGCLPRRWNLGGSHAGCFRSMAVRRAAELDPTAPARRQAGRPTGSGCISGPKSMVKNTCGGKRFRTAHRSS